MSDTIDLYFVPGLEGCKRDISSLNSFYSKLKLQEIFNGLLLKWNLFSEIEGKTVLIKPNWVMHAGNMSDELCLHTNHTFLLKFIESIAACRPGKIIIGDAPIQLCDWDLLLPDLFCNTIETLSASSSIPIEILDLRRSVWNEKRNMLIENKRPLDKYVIFNLKSKSFLEPVSSLEGNFRVTNYDPVRLRELHNSGTHKYCMSKELFEADVIFNVPKIKTHQKTGITNAMKNLVGLNGDKEFLPHHRIGGTKARGDCYPGTNPLRKLSEQLTDIANRFRGNTLFHMFAYFAAIAWHINKKSPYHNRAAGWYGNDTTWRMVLDLNYIALHGRIDGSLSETQARKIYSLSDGIIGGQGDGPLKPETFPLGVILFTDNLLLSDFIATILMGFDPDKIPLISKHLVKDTLNDFQIFSNNKQIILNDVYDMVLDARPSPGWIGHIEKGTNSDSLSFNTNGN